jgi:hypothetical protein
MIKNHPIVVVLIALIIVGIAGSIVYISHKKPSTNLSPASTSTENNNTISTSTTVSWKTFHSDRLGFTTQYPSNWSVNPDKNGSVVFTLPEDTTQILVSETHAYTKLSDLQGEIDATIRIETGSWNYADLGYEAINRRAFFKSSWSHQAQGLDYATEDEKNDRLLTIEFRMDNTNLAFEKSTSYANFKAFLALLKIDSGSTAENGTLHETTQSSTRSFENSYFKINLINGWTAVAAGNAVNITNANYINGRYILFINPLAEQTSGIEGGRFLEVAARAPGVELVSKPESTSYSYPICTTANSPEDNRGIDFNSPGTGVTRHDEYIVGDYDSAQAVGNSCNMPTDAKIHWYFSYFMNYQNSIGGYFGNYIYDLPTSPTFACYPGNGCHFAITMTYKTDAVNNLPIKGSSDLGNALLEMSDMVTSIKWK